MDQLTLTKELANFHQKTKELANLFIYIRGS